MHLGDVIKKIIITEKSEKFKEDLNKYTVVVDKNATKIDIKNAILKFYDRKVSKINLINTKPKYKIGRNRNLLQKQKPFKKVIITLQKNEKSIEFVSVKNKSKK